VRRTPPGRSLSGEEAGVLVGLSAFTVSRFVWARRLPARHGRFESLPDRRGGPEVVYGEPARYEDGLGRRG
jgi:hypothetical protein